MTDEPRGRAALLAPGGNYGTDGPLLMFAAAAAEERGASVHPLAWGAIDDLPDEEVYARVRARTAAAVDLLGAGPPPLVIAKSLGMQAVLVAAERGLPAVWFTPLLTDPELVAALRGSAAPFLLIGGDQDPWWDGALARSLTPHVLEVPGAGHRMFRPGPLKESAAALGDAATAVEEFLDSVVWPVPDSPANSR